MDRNERSSRCRFRLSASIAGKGDLLTAETRLVAGHGAGAALAIEAVEH